jgi:pantoate--beta-alanine ligase
VAHTRAELARALSAQAGSRALVMTMGALHEGHLSLVRRARELADHVVVSIFVNPAQFAPGEDYDAYPRSLDADLAALRTVGAEVVFAPQPGEVYPVPTSFTLDPGPIARVLEGATRPTHLAGVALIVAKVLNLVRPDVALFGQKDAQQLAMVRLLVRDLDLPVRIEGVPISRDTDGVARSSRNQYLSADERVHARALSRALREGTRIADEGGAASAVAAAARRVLAAEPDVGVDYVALADADTFEVRGQGDDAAAAGRPAYLLVAARVGATRLIDNTIVTPGGDPR